MKRAILFLAVLTVFGFAWKRLDVIDLRVVGQPSMTGGTQGELEKPFFESLAERTGLPIRVDYNSLDKLGFREDYQLAMLQNGYVDLVSLRFVPNSREEPSLLGADIPGLSEDFQSGKAIANAYFSTLDQTLQSRHKVKLLGLWTFGPQVLFCSKPIKQLSDLRGRKVRIQGASLAPLVRAYGGVPLVLPVDKVSEAFSDGILDCAISSEQSAYSAGWFEYVTHVYPIATQMGINGIVIRLEKWDALTSLERDKLFHAFAAYIEEAWAFAERARDRTRACLLGDVKCDLPQLYRVTVNPVVPRDLTWIRDFGLHQAFPIWAKECDAIVPECSARWKSSVIPMLSKLNAP